VLLHKPTQDATSSVYTFVPKQNFSLPWTDAKLYKKYELSVDEVSFIEQMIRPMSLDANSDNE
jgi:site-specific DNA-methyltransferase (adenine-specific)